MSEHVTTKGELRFGCANCGGWVTAQLGPDPSGERTILCDVAGKMRQLPIPDEMPLLTCEKCHETYFDAADCKEAEERALAGALDTATMEVNLLRAEVGALRKQLARILARAARQSLELRRLSKLRERERALASVAARRALLDALRAIDPIVLGDAVADALRQPDGNGGAPGKPGDGCTEIDILIGERVRARLIADVEGKEAVK